MQTKENYIINREAFESASTIKELKEFLDTVTLSYDECYHFTDFKALSGIIGNGHWRFSPLDMLNDTMEPSKQKGKWEKRISASFSHGDEDNIGMWKMYGENMGKDYFNPPLCITLPKAFFCEWKNKINESEEIHKELEAYLVLGKDEGDDNSKNNTNISAFVHDMVYYYGYENDSKAQLTWDNILKKINKEDLNQIACGNAGDLVGYIKNSAWEYERESRISIVAPKGYTFRSGKKIPVLVDEDSLGILINEMKIRVSPFSNYDNICLDCFVDRLKAVFDNNNKKYPTDLRQRCSMSFFKGRVNGKDSSKAPYRKKRNESSDGNLHQ